MSPNEVSEFVNAVNLMGPEAQSLFSIIITQVRVQAIQYLFTALLTGFAGYAGVRVTLLFFEMYESAERVKPEEVYPQATYIKVMLLSAILAVVFLAVSLDSLEGAVARFVNPAYYAVRLVLGGM